MLWYVVDLSKALIWWGLILWFSSGKTRCVSLLRWIRWLKEWFGLNFTWILLENSWFYLNFQVNLVKISLKIADFTRTREKFCYENCFGILSKKIWENATQGPPLHDQILSVKTWKNKRKCQKMVLFSWKTWKMVKYFISILAIFWPNSS